MSDFKQVFVEKNGCVHPITSEAQLASFLEDGWTVVEPKPVAEEKPKKTTKKK